MVTSVGFCFVARVGYRSLRVWFRISNSTHDVEIRNEIKSANIELCVICRFSLEKRLEIGRTLNFFRSSAPKKFGAVIISKFRFKKVRFCRPRSGVRRKLWSRVSGVTVFNGEFDSGSERTLAAWIRHASRAGFLSVAIQREVQRRTGA